MTAAAVLLLCIHDTQNPALLNWCTDERARNVTRETLTLDKLRRIHHDGPEARFPVLVYMAYEYS